MIKLVSRKISQKDNANRGVIFPVIGEAHFDKDGLLEVEDDKVEELIALTVESFDFEVHGKPKQPAQKKKDDELAEFLEQLDTLTETELLELVRDSGDKKLQENAAGMPNQRIKEALAKIMYENNKVEKEEGEKKEVKKKSPGRPKKVAQ